MPIQNPFMYASSGGWSNTTNLTDDATGWSGDTNNWTFGTDEQVTHTANVGSNTRTAIYYDAAGSSGTIEGPFEIQWKMQTLSGGAAGTAIYRVADQSLIGTTGNTYNMGMWGSASNHWANSSVNPSSGTGLFVNVGTANATTVEEGYTNAASGGSVDTDTILQLSRSSNGVITFGKDDTVIATHSETTTDDMRVAIGSSAEGNSGNWNYVRLLQ